MSANAPAVDGEGGAVTGRPLAGIRLLELTQGAMAAIARYFAELGADVIRLEPAKGAADRREGMMAASPFSDAASIPFHAANLGKRSAPDTCFDTLVADADILVMPHGARDAEALRKAYPRLVILSVSDFGDTPGFAHWKGSGPVFHALSGELSRSGLPGRAPLLPPGDLAVECAIVQAVYVTMVACWQALQTGRGDHVDFSILDGAVQALDPGYGVGGSAAAGVRPSALPRGRPNAAHLYPILPCKDGFVRFCVMAPRQWQGLLRWMGEPAEFADPSFNAITTRYGSPDLVPAMARFLAGMTRLEVEAGAQQHGVPAAALLDLDEALQSPQMTARSPFKPVEIAPGLAAPFPDGVMEIDGCRMGIRSPAPSLPDRSTVWHESPPMPRGNAAPQRPLNGIKVLDFGVIVVGSEAGRMLADQGADVIKVESSTYPDGLRQTAGPEPVSASYASGNRNKKSIAINIRDPRGKALLLDLVRQSDVILSNFKGGTLESLGLDHAALKHINPRIIVTDSSAYGPTGPWARRMGYGPLVRASAGLTMQWRYPHEETSFSDAITIYPDHVAGRIVAIGVLALLIRRRRTGRGGRVSVSQAEVMLCHLGKQIAARALGLAGATITNADEHSQVYPCAGDDDWCVVTIRGDADRQAISRVTGDVPLNQWLAHRPASEAMQKLQEAGVAAGAMLRISELPDFAYFKARGFFRSTRHPHIAEAVIMENAPARFAMMPDPADGPAPLLGEHTEELLRERLGISDDELADLLAQEVVEQHAGG
ncbi:CoA transferase [Altererythrobacter confluentis]|uniref:CoA transferase n=1 Tax=Allopontixanthobacter confluentis TaxID=1849021 RepID=A0A6L7GHE0_9SPHN|nr:CoA transferase [Allopontixanthobacter confluentis]MXP14915.1 CoA transferase [Allopontixanthobacter confluentis]